MSMSMSMSPYPWEHRKPRGRAAARLEQPTFTPEEISGLLALRDRVQRCSLDLELGLDERRLRFARWLVEQGRLSEEW